MRPRLTLAGQLLGLQLGIMCVVLVGVAAVSVAQSYARFAEVEAINARAVAETVAAADTVRARLERWHAVQRGQLPADPDGEPTNGIRIDAENARSVSGFSSVIVLDASSRVLASADPEQLSTSLGLPDSPLATGRGWIGEAKLTGRRTVLAQVPVISDGDQPYERLGEVVGVVAVARDRPSLVENFELALPNLLTYLGIASALGMLGSLLVARRVKRQTLGLEPREITALVEHREAMLHGVKEGVVAVDRQGRVSLVNDGAAELLHLPPDAVGRTLVELSLDPALADILTGGREGSDVPVAVGDRVLILNRMPIRSRGRLLGSVTTLRDRTELIALQRELDTVQQATDTLRAQAHEFRNRLHTISGLIELGEYDEVKGYVNRVTTRDAELTDTVTSRIADPAVAALLVAKSSLAAEQGIELRIAPAARLGQVDEKLSSDVATVLGNLVDNALDALAPGPGWVEVEVRDDDGAVLITVRDSGPGVSPEVAAHVFRRGFSTKVAAVGGQRGVGLALVRLICVSRGGEVRLDNAGGAVFVARLPMHAQVAREGSAT